MSSPSACSWWGGRLLRSRARSDLLGRAEDEPGGRERAAPFEFETLDGTSVASELAGEGGAAELLGHLVRTLQEEMPAFARLQQQLDPDAFRAAHGDDGPAA